MTIVFAPHSWGLSHVGRSLKVAEVLMARGHRCVMVGDGPYVLPEGSLARRSGIEVSPLADLTMEDVVGSKNFDFHSPASLARLVQAEREMIRALSPSVIVSSYRPSIHVAAAIERVPVVALINTEYTHYWGTPLTPPKEHPITLKLTRLLGDRLAPPILERIAPLVADVLFRRTAGVYNELLAAHGLPRRRDILKVLEGAPLTYLTDAPEWCATKQPLPDGVRVAGPLYWTAEAAPGWDAALPGDAPIVYLSAGSSANPEVFPALFRELADLPCRVVMTTAGLPLPDGVPANFTLASFLPGDAIMRKSAFAILNGGSGTIYQAIDTRTPMLLVPMRADQEWNARDAEAHGIARSVHCRQVIDEPGRLRAAALEMLAAPGAFKERLDVLAAQLDRYRAAETVADGVEALMGATAHG